MAHVLLSDEDIENAHWYFAAMREIADIKRWCEMEDLGYRAAALNDHIDEWERERAHWADLPEESVNYAYADLVLRHLKHEIEKIKLEILSNLSEATQCLNSAR